MTNQPFSGSDWIQLPAATPSGWAGEMYTTVEPSAAVGEGNSWLPARGYPWSVCSRERIWLSYTLRDQSAQLAWRRSARRWAELTTPVSRTDPALVEAAGQLRAAIRAAVATQTGWATPEQIAGRIDLPATAVTLHRSLVDSVELAYVTREIASNSGGIAATSTRARPHSQTLSSAASLPRGHRPWATG
jgi:hypothetical protein